MTLLKKLGAKSALSRVKLCMPESDQLMHEPSAEADMHSESSALMEMKLTGPRCSL